MKMPTKKHNSEKKLNNFDKTEKILNWSLEDRLFLVFITNNVSRIEKDQNELKIQVSQIDDFFEESRIQKMEIEKIVDSVYEKSIDFQDEKGNYIKHRILISAKYDQGELILTFTDFIVPHLVQLNKEFTQHRLNIYTHPSIASIEINNHVISDFFLHL